MARRIALAMVLVTGCSARDIPAEDVPADVTSTTQAAPSTTTTTVPPTTTTTVEMEASTGRTSTSVVRPTSTSTAPPPAGSPAEGAVVKDEAFWRRLADCECASGHCGGGHVGWFQFSPDTAAKVGIDGSEGYEEQRAAAIEWARRIHPRENTTSGWPHCWDVAA